jgi:hypothetical protein
VLMTCCSTPFLLAVFSPEVVRTCKTYLVLSVLPEPDSPDIRMHWFFLEFMSSRSALDATPKMCGSFVPPDLCNSNIVEL